MTIYLIRHGKTLANERRLYCGSTDIGLCSARCATTGTSTVATTKTAKTTTTPTKQ